MAEKLALDELGARTRAANQRRAARQQQRWRAAGRVALTVWMDSTTKARIEAARNGGTLNETAERLLSLGLEQIATTTPATSNPPVYTGVVSRDDLMTEVGKLLDEGHTGADIARKLNDSGQRTATGSEFNGANLLRDYRRWMLADLRRQSDGGLAPTESYPHNAESYPQAGG